MKDEGGNRLITLSAELQKQLKLRDKIIETLKEELAKKKKEAL
jgi:hypothetical protein